MLEGIAGVAGGLKYLLDEGTERSLYGVRIHYDVDHPKFHGEDHIILDKELEAFLKATLELHYVPGINPHNRCETKPAQVISIAPLTKTGPYWWAIPGLDAGIVGNIRADLKRGASTYEWGTPVVVWVRPGVVIPHRWRDIYIQH